MKLDRRDYEGQPAIRPQLGQIAAATVERWIGTAAGTVTADETEGEPESVQQGACAT